MVNRESSEPKGSQKIFFNSVYDSFFFLSRKHSIRERYRKDLIRADCRIFNLVSCLVLRNNVKEAVSLWVPENILKIQRYSGCKSLIRGNILAEKGAQI